MGKKTIYIRTNIINGMQYVGQTNDFKARERSWRKTYQSYANQYIDKDRIEFGLDAFTVDILEIVDESIADEKEREYIKKYNTLYPNGYNRTTGGNEGYTFSHTEETLKRMSEVKKGKIFSEEHKRKIGLAHAIPVYQYTLDGELVKVWESASDAARELGCSQPHITQCCYGGNFDKSRNKWVNRTQCNGYKWSYNPL